MIFSLFWKECRQNIKSLTYLIYVCCLILFFVTQLGSMTVIKEPQPGQKKYGQILSDDKEVQMKCALTDLFLNYQNNLYVTYPLGFYKSVTLDEKEQETVREVLETVSGRSIEELEKTYENYQNEVNKTMRTTETEINFSDIESFSIVPYSGISYDKFLEEMKKVDRLLGGESRFCESRIKSEAYEEMTYEQAKEEYEKVITKDKVSGAYAREFCDYFGILLAILPVFLAATRAVRDQRAKVFEVIASKKISSVKVVITRYVAVVTVTMIPVVVLAVSPAMQTMYLADSLGVSGDIFMYGKYILGWLLPSVLFTVAAGFFFSELAGGAVSILVMGLYWLFSLFQSGYKLTGTVGWNLIPRFNSLGKRTVFDSIFQDLVRNRIGYTVVAVLLLAAAVFFYDRKRKGRWIKNGKRR